MHPSQAKRGVFVIGARLDFGAHARQRHPMDAFEVIAVAPLDRVGAREVSAKNRALRFQCRETLVDRRIFQVQPCRDFAGGCRAAGFQRAADEFDARRVAICGIIVCGGEDFSVFGDDDLLGRIGAHTDACDSILGVQLGEHRARGVAQTFFDFCRSSASRVL